MATYSGTALSDLINASQLSDLVYGLAGNDSLVGRDGADTLDGGTGADHMAGVDGNDTYVVDSSKDTVFDVGNAAHDRLLASISIDLNDYANIEHATLTGTAALNAAGDAGANMLIGNAGANKLDGRAGDDTMIGAGGSDTYTVDSSTDVVTELEGEGVDQVNSAVDFDLGEHLEKLTLNGSGDIDGAGNAIANTITGNAGKNALSGEAGNDTLTGNDGDDTLDGGAGADSMTGGKGEDEYFVDDIGDKVADSGPAGEDDTVNSSITYILGTTIERLELLAGGSIDGTGNALDNAIFGNTGHNVVSGLAGDDFLFGNAGDDLLLGGDGRDQLTAGDDADTLVGGAGRDLFAFTGIDGLDVVGGFDMLTDKDQINFESLLVGFKIGVSDIADFVQTVTAGGSTTVRIDADGTVGGANFVDVFVLQGISTDLTGLIENGAIPRLVVPSGPPVTGTAAGETLPGTGNSELILGLGGNDALDGLAGADTLDGGAGMDSLIGGTGNDTYIVDNAKDAISEAGGDTNDRVLASIAIDLVNYLGVEHVTLTGTAGLAATGNFGANMLIGNSGANKLDGKGGGDTLIGGAGTDTYEVDSATDVIIEYAGEGTDQVNSAATHSLDAFVENLTLTGGADIDGSGNALANKIVGNSGDNTLSGGDGNDTLTGNDGDDLLFGGQGVDSMAGGAGDDLYDVDNIGDKVTEGAGAGDDRVNSSITYVLGANFENLKLIGANAIDGTGNALNNDIDGNGSDNILSGLAGNDSLLGAAGNDLLLGGAGDDSLFFSSGFDTLVGGAGRDTFGGGTITDMDLIMGFDPTPGGDVIDVSGLLVGFVPGVSNIDDFLFAGAGAGNTIIRVDVNGLVGGANFVDLVLLQGVVANLDLLLASDSILGVGDSGGTPISGGAGADTLPAPSDANLVFGLAGNDSLTGSPVNDWLDGGAGADTMVGGGGSSDTYVVDSTKDVIDASGGSINDRIIASISIDLTSAPYALLEHVTLTGTAALNATGNASDNLLIGNAGANKLDGKASDDVMVGGAGNDIYTVDQTDDEVIELAGEGTDQVNSSADFTLSAFVENLTLTDVAAIEGIGNALANKIVGNSAGNNLAGDAGNDTLTGNDGDDFIDGGAGADSMAGGAGIDFYIVDNIGDKIVESGPASEFDVVISDITYTLGTGLEDLILGISAGAIDGTGNALNNAITGNDSDNVLSGLAGNDTLSGDSGADLLLGGAGRDVLVNSIGQDTLVGGADSDVFRFDVVAGIDVIADFNGLPGGDLIDLSVLLTLFDPDSSNINDFLRMTADGSTLQIDPTGAAGGAVFTSVVTLQGVSTDIAGLLNNGSLVLE